MRAANFVSFLVVSLALAGTVTAQRRDGPMHGAGQGPGAMRGMGGMHSMIRHRYVVREGLPESYRSLASPLTPTSAVLADGRRVFDSTCAACHGETGEGDGPAGVGLDPRPSNLRMLPPMPMFSSDAYLYWTVAEGGAPVGSAMPAFRETLTANEIWSVVMLLREGL